MHPIPIEEHFRLIADTAPNLIWLSGPDKLCYFFNAGWLRFRGRTQEQEYGNGWVEGVHPDDLQRCLDIYTTNFNARQPFKMEYRLQRFDGVYRWIIDHGVPRYSADGTFAGYTGSCMDVDELLETKRVKSEYISLKALEKEQLLYDQLVQAHRQLQQSEDNFRQINLDLEGSIRQRTRELERATIDIEVQRDQFRAYLNAIPQIAWTNTLLGEVDFYNQQWYNYTGLTFEETKAWGWKAVIHPDDLQYNLDCYQAIIKGETGGEFEIREKRKDGTYRWHLARILPLKDDSGKIIHWIGTATDIQALKEAQLQKDEFLSIASHELKTPLTSIKAFNQLMKRNENPHKMQEFVQKSGDHILRLEKLINDLLDVSRINAGKMSYDMKLFSFTEMLQEGLDSVQMTAPRHQIILEGLANVDILGDRLRLEQVLQNFLNNAVKYSPHGGKILVNSYVKQGGLIVSIQDFGIGVEKQHLSKLFDRYYRIDNTAMRFDGLGLGLFISSEIIKRHKGSFWIESELGKGATFYFRLPLQHTEHHLVNITENDDFYRDPWITINYNQQQQRIELQWTGFQDFDSVKRSCLKILDMVIKNKATQILADNTYVEGSWADATEWVGKEYYPMLESAGIKHLAWIYSLSVFSQLAAEKSVDMVVGNIITQFFNDRHDADIWLTSMA